MNPAQPMLQRQEPAAVRQAKLPRLISAALASMAMCAGAQAPPATPPAEASDTEAKTPSGQSASSAQSLQTVIVTATRRREPIKEVPMQINVLNADTLAKSGANNLADYMADQPGVNVQSGGGPGISEISVRGVTTGAQTIATVGSYVDDIPVGSSTAFARGQSMALDMGLLDLNHIELLRGPQGTLYGAGAMGGVLKYVTNQPETDRFFGSVSLTGSKTRGGGTGFVASTVLNVPLKEDVAGLRVSAFHDKAAGYVDSIGTVKRSPSNGGDTSGARASLLLEPVSRLKLRATVTTQRLKRDGYDFVDYDTSTGKPLDGKGTRQLAVAESYDVDIDLYSAEAEYDFGWARLSAVTSGQKTRSPTVQDATTYVPLLAGFGLHLGTIEQKVAVKVDKQTQELRLLSKSDKQFEWLAGFFYTHEKSNNRQGLDATTTDGSPSPDLLTAELPSDYKETAAYGDITWKFANGLSLTGGLRVARNKQSYTQISSGLLLGGDDAFTAGSSETARTYLLTGGYKLSPQSSLYARVASGYRPGGPNAVIRNAAGELAAPKTFKHDTLTSYEAGYKADLLDKTLSVEAAVYDIEWRDVQQYLAVNGVRVIINGGAARVRGAELSTRYVASSQLTLSAGAALTDAELTEDAPGLGAVAGQRMPTSARFSGQVNGTYRFGLFGHQAYAGANLRYVGARNVGFQGSDQVPYYRMPAYTLADLQAGIDLGRFTLSLYVRNLFDREAQQGADSSVTSIGGPLFVSRTPGRTFGATVTVPF